ncbi:hypothetical protein EDB87DRAFT_1618976 [Lactarius vividus]|nr:hypothetical protein EDB87DRAFT_1618976 [Lactarius vividus]
MENQPTIPPADPQPRHIPGYAFRPNMPTYQQDENPTPQDCSCMQCSDVRRTQALRSSQLISSSQNTTTVPYLNQDQGVDNRTETAMIVPDHALAQFVPPQIARTQDNDNFGYAPVHERARPSQHGSRRLLAGRYLNNPDAHVSIIRLELGPSGQFQVIITLEMTNAV